ncbi:MAG: aminopeptidase P family N-terminal domain-containing protein, partial [Chloroflexi bacterium]|nr:aminopeptidase P family N-terminal domain-containing protein [Chloroflexota bacterium]
MNAQTTMTLQLPQTEFDQRCQKLLTHVKQKNLAGVVLFDNYFVHYFSAFAFIPTERPIAFAMNARGERALFVPRLEVEHAKSSARVERVESYPEYPDNPHPMARFKDVLATMGIAKKIGADNDGYPLILGYNGPALSALTGAAIENVNAFVNSLMAIKSDAELALIRESCKWGNLAHRLLQKYTHVGANEVEVSKRASIEATLTLIDTLGPLYRALSFFDDGPSAGYRGQIGRNAAIPHS